MNALKERQSAQCNHIFLIFFQKTNLMLARNFAKKKNVTENLRRWNLTTIRLLF